MLLLKNLVLVAALAAVPLFAAPAFAQSHDDHATGAQSSATAAPTTTPAKPEGPMQCPMMKGGMAGNGMPQDRKDGTPAPKPMGDKGSGGMMMSMMMDGKEMHCLQAQASTPAPTSTPVPTAPDQHDHNHSGAPTPQ